MWCEHHSGARRHDCILALHAGTVECCWCCWCFQLFHPCEILQPDVTCLQADADHTLAEVLPLQEQLDEIDAERWVCFAGCSLDSVFVLGTVTMEADMQLLTNPHITADLCYHPCRRLSKGGSFASGTDTAQPGEAVCNEVSPTGFQLRPCCHAGSAAQLRVCPCATALRVLRMLGMPPPAALEQVPLCMAKAQSGLQALPNPRRC